LVTSFVTLIVDVEVVHRRPVRLGRGKSTAGEVDVMGGTEYKHSPTNTNTHIMQVWYSRV